MGAGEWSSSLRRMGGRAVVALVGALLVGGALSAATPASAASAASPDAAALTCEQMLGADLIAQLEASGLVASPETSTTLFPADASRQCWWYDADSPRVIYFGAGYMPAGDELVASESARLLAIPSFFQDGDDSDGIRLRSDGRLTESMAEYIDGSWQFQARDGYWFYVVQPVDVADPSGAETRIDLDTRMDAVMDTLQQNVIAALAPTEAAPSAPPAAVAPAGFTADQPSTLSGLATVAELSLTPTALGGCLAAAVVLAALVGLPGRLVDSALSARYDDWARFLTPFVTGSARLRQRLDRLPRALVLGGGLVVASVFAALVEPDLGINGGSFRLVLSILTGMVVESLLGLALIVLWLGRRGQPSSLALRPGSLLVVLITALLSRAVGFEPGFVFGLVLAVVLAGAPSEEREADASIAEGAWLLVLGLAGWLSYSGTVAVGWADAGVVGLFVAETLAAVTVGCLSALPLVMLPLPGLPGRALWRRGRLIWAAAESIGVAVFVLVVLPFPQSWETIGAPFTAWVVAFAVYAALAIGLWAVLSFTPSGWLTPSDGPAAADRELGDGADAVALDERRLEVPDDASGDASTERSTGVPR